MEGRHEFKKGARCEEGIQWECVCGGGGGKGGEHQVNTIKICYTHVKLSTNFKSTNGNTKRAIKYANLEFAPRI